jgi:hypothetical protein
MRSTAFLFGFLVSLCLSVPAFSQDYQKDTDHDGFPDLIEQGSGYNPGVNEFLKKCSAGGKCGELKTDFLYATSPETVLLILDVSGSMSEPMGDESKIDVAKKILSKYIDAIPPSMKTGLVIYGKSGCDDDSTELLVPIGDGNKKAIKAKIADLKPSGSTPIAATIMKSPDFFKGFESCSNRLVLVSDGEESCSGDPVQAIRDFKSTQYNPQVTVIGLNVDSSTRKQLSKIAGASDGTYADVKNEADMVKAFSSFFDDMNKGFKDIVCIVNQYNVYLKEETDQYNKTNAYLLKAFTKSKSDEEKTALKKVESQIKVNHEKRVKAKDELSRMIKQKEKDMEDAKNKFIGK